MTFDWWTLALQAVNFIVLVWLLWRFLFRPVRRVIEKRKALAEAAFAEADKARAAAEEARKRHEEGQAALEEKRAEMLRDMHKELESQRARTQEAAKRDADAMLAEARTNIKREREEAVEALRRQAATLAVELAATLLKSSGSTALDNGCLEQIGRELESLPADERKRLSADLSTPSAVLSVVTASPLASDDQDRWRRRIDETLGLDDRLRFETDPALLGGARLCFPHAVLDFSWAAQLARAQETLTRNDSAS